MVYYVFYMAMPMPIVSIEPTQYIHMRHKGRKRKHNKRERKIHSTNKYTTFCKKMSV